MKFEITADVVTHVSFHKNEEFQVTPQITQDGDTTVFAASVGTTMYRIETTDTGVAGELEQFAASCRAQIEGKRVKAV